MLISAKWREGFGRFVRAFGEWSFLVPTQTLAPTPALPRWAGEGDRSFAGVRRPSPPPPSGGGAGWGQVAAWKHETRSRPSTGSVTLVGAGPGDPDLLTVAAVKALAAADVVLYDHLVGDGILDLAHPKAERICVGKRSGRHSLPQDEINALIAAQALMGRRVVRLKGGDPMIFGRAGEEIDHLDELGIPVRVVPGITAALGCAASTGLSLTKRGVARAVTFVTAHGRDGERFEPDWARLADPNGTLAIYMGREQARAVGRGLTGAGLSPDTPVLAVENGCRPDERRYRTTLGAMAADGVAAGKGPTLLLVGEALRPRGAGADAVVAGAAHAVDALGAGGDVG